jgi:peptidylprolyl isomerase
MLKNLRFLAATAILVSFATLGHAASPEDTLVISLKDGDVSIALRPDLAPKHVEQIKALTRKGFYDGVVFHRVINGFMAQTGDGQFGDSDGKYDLAAAGTGSSDMPDIAAEFSAEPFVRGTVGMARSQDPNSANSQFFIMFAPGDFLNGQYTVVGNVETGMELVDKIKRGDDAQNGVVMDPDKMLKVKIAADK